MCSTLQLYCRFCAREPKQHAKLMDLATEHIHFKQIVKKLSYLNASYVDLTDETIPKTICFSCFESLENAYDFLSKVQHAQTIIKEFLSKRFPKSESDESEVEPSSTEQDASIKIKPECPDNSKPQESEELSSTEQDTSIQIKAECPDNSKPQESEEELCSTEQDTSIQIKAECPDNSKPQEIDLSCNVNNELEKIPVSSEKDLAKNLNVQELDAVNSDNKIGTATNATLYALLSKRKSWKDYLWMCSVCKMGFPELFLLRTHTKEVHRKCFAFACSDCNAKPDDFEKFIAHARMHRSYLRLCCTYCDAVAENPDASSNHLSSHFHQSEQACKLCGEILTDCDSLEEHTSQYSTLKSPKKRRRKRSKPITTEELTCKHCNKVYKTRTSLQTHSKLHTAERTKNYTCDRCGKSYYDKGNLISHLMAHDKVKRYACKICNKSFLFLTRLRRHVKTHSSVKSFTCEQCGKSYKTQSQLTQHKVIHTDSMPYSCQYCDKKFQFKSNKDIHERQHTGARPYTCEICTMEFTNWPNYNKHMKRRHNTDTSKRRITPKGAFPVNPETGQPMKMSHTVEIEEWKTRIMVPSKRGRRKFCCAYCDAVAENPVASFNHLSVHFHQSEQACKLCGEILTDCGALEEHTLQYSTLESPKKPRRKRGTPITTEELTCKHCNKVYKNLNSLQAHSKLHTAERTRNYTCDRCGKAFYEKRVLIPHLLTHDQVKPHACKICNKSFLFPAKLRMHVKTHSGVKPFKCEQCGRCFKSPCQLKQHKIIHTDSMPYSCRYCDKTFRFRQIKKNHELQHTGAKPYMCEICSMEFTNWSNYNKHMKRKHGTDTSKKKITPEGVIPVNPETGQPVKISHTVEIEEWKTRIMLPCKRGKKT